MWGGGLVSLKQENRAGRIWSGRVCLLTFGGVDGGDVVGRTRRNTSRCNEKETDLLSRRASEEQGLDEHPKYIDKSTRYGKRESEARCSGRLSERWVMAPDTELGCEQLF